VDNRTRRTAPDKIAVVREWYVPNSRKHVKSCLQFCSCYEKLVHHFYDYAAPLTDLCRKNILGNVVHTEVTKAVLSPLKLK